MLEKETSFDTIRRRYIPFTGPMILIAIISLVIALWIAGGVVLALLWRKIQTTRNNLLILLHARRDTIPLLIILMRPYVIKADEVFIKITSLHQQLLWHDNNEDEQEVSRQIQFLFTVAQHHSDLLHDTRYIAIRNELQQHNEHIHETSLSYNMAVSEFIRGRKIMLFVLSPLSFVPISLSRADL